MDVSAQTPIEDLIIKYRDYQGTDCVMLNESELIMALPALLSSPLKSVASDVQKLSVLHMYSAAHSVRESFAKNLYDILELYDVYEQRRSANGVVEIYAMSLDDDQHVSELVIFNPDLWILNYICGYFSQDSLDKL